MAGAEWCIDRLGRCMWIDRGVGRALLAGVFQRVPEKDEFEININKPGAYFQVR
jgi:hypothetical protein